VCACFVPTGSRLAPDARRYERFARSYGSHVTTAGGEIVLHLSNEFERSLLGRPTPKTVQLRITTEDLTHVRLGKALAKAGRLTELLARKETDLQKAQADTGQDSALQEEVSRLRAETRALRLAGPAQTPAQTQAQTQAHAELQAETQLRVGNTGGRRAATKRLGEDTGNPVPCGSDRQKLVAAVLLLVLAAVVLVVVLGGSSCAGELALTTTLTATVTATVSITLNNCIDLETVCCVCCQGRSSHSGSRKWAVILVVLLVAVAVLPVAYVQSATTSTSCSPAVCTTSTGASSVSLADGEYAVVRDVGAGTTRVVTSIGTTVLAADEVIDRCESLMQPMFLSSNSLCVAT